MHACTGVHLFCIVGVLRNAHFILSVPVAPDQAGDKKKWRAMIQYNHEQHHVGYYPTAEEAARAYDRKALLFMGPSAITNFPAADYEGENLEAEGDGGGEQVLGLFWLHDSRLRPHHLLCVQCPYVISPPIMRGLRCSISCSHHAEAAGCIAVPGLKQA